MKKRKTTFRIGLVVLILLIVFWAVNNFCIKVEKTTLLSEKITSPVRIVLVSDLHSSSFGKDNVILKNLIKQQKPDLIFVLGDMYSRFEAERPETAVEFTTALTEYAPVYFVSGDHDYSDKYFKALEDGGVNVLNFEKSDVTVNENEISIYGIRSEWFSLTFSLNNAFSPADGDRINILLAHCPYMEKYKGFENLDFVFSGDTHGGMIRLPLLGPVYYNGSILPKITYSGKMYDKGYYNVNGTQLFVTSGAGNYPLPLRFNNRPEIVSIDLLPKSQ
ncbi:MAG: metallophosphoesterase [Clostridia bacterium]|nr:metallophosphoesterase [Clostridia bacterium]